MKTKLTFSEIKKYLEAPISDFPKYASQILNLANQNAQATRPRVVGQLSDLMQKFSGKELAEWEEWYLKQYPEAIKIATGKIFEMVQQLKVTMGKIDRQMVEQWVKDLVIVKTFVGLRFQEAILKKVAGLLNTDYRLSTVEEESRGIDGFIGNRAVSIKPDTYRAKPNLGESIHAKIIFYAKLKNGVEVDYSLLAD